MSQEYSPKFKESIVKKLFGPNSITMSQLCRETGLPITTVHGWKKKFLNKGKIVTANNRTKKSWSAKEKLSVVIETAPLNQHDMSEYCRTKGLYPEQISEWKTSFIEDADNKISTKEKCRVGADYRKKIKRLESELLRKEKALAETAALLVLSKKFQAGFVETEED